MIRRIKFFLFYLLSAFSKPARSIAEREQTREENRLRAILTDRTEEKIQAYKEWSKPENVAKRYQEHEAKAAEALEKALELKKLYGWKEDPPLPPLEELPEYMRNQAPSTIRAMLRHKECE